MKRRLSSHAKSMPARRQSAARKTGSGSATSAAVAGIHNRRDKRYPMSSMRAVAEPLPADKPTTAASPLALHRPDAPHTVDSVPKAEGLEQDAKWQEALMLWLSWNSSYERLTAKMCRPNQSQQKLEALMDEMDALRVQAIDLSEELIRRSG